METKNENPQILTAYGTPHQLKSKQGSKFYLIFFGVIFLGFGLLYSFGKYQELQKKESNVLLATTSKTASTIPPEWKTFSSKSTGIIFSAPPTMSSTENPDGSINLELFGTKQLTRSEFFDGIKMAIKREDLGSKTLKQIGDEAVKKEQAAYKQITNPLSTLTVNAKNGFIFTSQRITKSTYVFLPDGDKKFLSVLYELEDPEKKGYQDIVDQVIASLQVTKSSDLIVETPKSNIGEKSEQTNKNINTISSIDTSSWKKVSIDDVYLEFSIPPKITAYGEVKSMVSTVPTGYNGSQICIGIVLKQDDDPCTVVLFGVGTITKNYNVARAALYIDLQGFEQNDGKYYALLGANKIELPAEAVKEIKNPNGVPIIKVRGLDDANGQSLAGTPGSGWIAGLVNTKSEQYPGITVLVKIVQNISEIDVDEILNTFRYTE